MTKMAMAQEILNTFPRTFIPMFVAMDVFWVLCVFAPMVEGLDEDGRKRIVRQSVITALAVSLGFMAVGKIVFGILGITVGDFMMAGGLLLLILSIADLLRQGASPLFGSSGSGVVPLGVPLIVGPAVLTTILVLIEHYGALHTVISLLVNLLIVWGALSGAARVFKVIPRSYVVALSKLMSLLLAAIAVMMIRLGLQTILGAQ